MNHSIFSSPPNPPGQSTEGIKMVPAAVPWNAMAKINQLYSRNRRWTNLAGNN
ncbi:hypothetical protein GQ55_9G136500 [Panicum hallii var. hallii]|uniref:Uncharacterized protein n=1 Tax=Panicum hallii var. hallii TaxID=1504633 RepID=A0A2T7C2V7_9POAL|nr:hypothetical protein GQ55_9G136500 [Panicum hallii var. hallii]